MNILIVDDHPMVRKGIASTLSLEENVEEIREASNVEEAKNLMAKSDSDIAFIDLKLGKQNGLEIAKWAKSKNISTKFIVLTSSSDKEDFISAQELGIEGYILKEAYIEDIIYAFNVVARGKKFYDPELFLNKADKSENDMLEELTDREKDVLAELGKGLSNQKIAGKLFISENTVKKHVSNILFKLGLNHRIEAALYINNPNNRCINMPDKLSL